MSNGKKPLQVHKFGGTSLALHLEAPSGNIRDKTEEFQIVVVVSAIAGVTDKLFEACQTASRKDKVALEKAVEDLRKVHIESLEDLAGWESPERIEVRPALDGMIQEVAELLKGVCLTGELTPRMRDRVLAYGEKLATRLFTCALFRDGIKAHPLYADTFLETDDRFGEATPGIVQRTVTSTLRPYLEQGIVPVVTGFCGRAPDGSTTTMGRGGSDLTATLIGAALGAQEVVLWSDVDGVFSADPTMVPGARVIPQLNYREASEMSFYGAKVLHQRTMIPVAALGIPVRSKNTMRPLLPGTVVDGRFTPGSHPVKAISAIRKHSLLSIEGKGMAGVPGIAARVFGALARHEISVTMISQSSSECTICLAIPQEHVLAAEGALKREFRPVISKGDIEEIVVQRNIGLIAAVGLGMAQTPGVSARIFGALGKSGINVLAIAQGSSELNVSLAVTESDVPVAVKAIHDEFGLHRIDTGIDTGREFDIMLLGCGKVGRALADLILERKSALFERFGLRRRLVAIADRNGFVFRSSGIPKEELRSLLEMKSQGGSLAAVDGYTEARSPVEMVRKALGFRLGRPVLVDVSDADEAYDVFREALKRGCDIVTANKKPLAGPAQQFQELMDDAKSRGRLLKAEATVGAGLPVIETLEMLLATGDQPHQIEGCLSGTLAFLMSKLEEGALFSEAVVEAAQRGYTEPDPAIDLTGGDVARKGTILGRWSGLAPQATVELEGLVDDSLLGLPREELMKKL